VGFTQIVVAVAMATDVAERRRASARHRYGASILAPSSRSRCAFERGENGGGDHPGGGRAGVNKHH
jgi:uncharacterized membrane protein